MEMDLNEFSDSEGGGAAKRSITPPPGDGDLTDCPNKRKSDAQRDWCFTFWPEDGSPDAVMQWLVSRAEMFGDAKVFKYVVCGVEQGAVGAEAGAGWHIQGYLELSHRQKPRLTGVKKLLQCTRVHVEGRLGTRAEARDYCLKDGHFREFGTWYEAGAGHRVDLDELAALVLEGKTDQEIAAIAPVHVLKHRRHIQDLREAARGPPRMRPEISVHVFWGDAGAGKSRAALRMVEELKKPYYWRSCSDDWFDGYNGEEVVVVDDFGGDMTYKMFLRLTDRYPLRVPVKGGYPPCFATTVIFTSNTHPCMWYPFLCLSSRNAVARRFTSVVEYKFKLAPGQSLRQVAFPDKPPVVVDM